MLCCSVCICGFSWEPSLAITALAMTGRGTPHARPSATERDTGEWVYNTVYSATQKLTSFGWYKHVWHVLLG